MLLQRQEEPGNWTKVTGVPRDWMTKWGAGIIPSQGQAAGHMQAGFSFTFGSITQRIKILERGREAVERSLEMQAGRLGWTQGVFLDFDGWAGGDLLSLAQLRLPLPRARWIEFPPSVSYCPQTAILVFKPFM